MMIQRYGQRGGQSVGAGPMAPYGQSGSGCEFNSYPGPCANYGYPNVAGAAMAAMQGGGMSAGVDMAASQAGLYPGQGVPPWMSFCNIYPQARGAVCTAFGFPETSIPALSSVNVVLNPPNPSQIRCFDIPSDIAANLVLDAFTIGGRPVLYGPIPLRLFDQSSRACSKYFTSDTIIPGVGAAMTIRNTLNQPVTLRGALGITEIRC